MTATEPSANLKILFIVFGQKYAIICETISSSQEAIPIAQGKFSKPRSNHSQDELLDRTFREVSEQPRKRPAPQNAEPPKQEEPTLEELLAQPVPEEPAPINQTVPSYPPVQYDNGPEEEEDEDDFEEESPFLAFFARNQKVLLICCCALVLLTLVGILAGVTIVSKSDPYDNRILNNVTLAGLNLGGMTKEEAAAAIEEEFGGLYSTTDMVVTLSETVLTFSPKDTGASLDVDAAVKAAYSYGRTGTKSEKEAAYQSSLTGVHTIGLMPYLNLNEAYIQQVLEEYASGFSSIFTDASYKLEGERPELAADKFDLDDPCQILVITMGTPGMGVDTRSLYNEILDAYSLGIFSIEKEEATPDMLPEKPDLQAIYDEYYIAPVDASIDTKTFETIPGSYGYDFDLDAAQELIDDADFGEVVKIPMRCIAPEIQDDELLFRDELGSCKTKHTKDENRNTNLKVACEAINGTVLKPGETFSFNDHLGERTEQKGYKPAGTYAGTKLVDTVGGGICQVSTTLYYCTLLADLQIVDRINHSMPVTYIDYGLDATVSWGGPDFKFKNSTNFPIKLLAEVKDGYVAMKIMGTDEKDYFIKMEYEFTGVEKHETVYEEHDESSGYYDGQVLQGGSDGLYVRSYKCKYDKKTGELISRDFEARSHYKKVDKVVVKLVEPEEETQPTETEPVETKPEETKPVETQTPTQPSAPPETTPSTESTTPPAETTQPPVSSESSNPPDEDGETGG